MALDGTARVRRVTVFRGRVQVRVVINFNIYIISVALLARWRLEHHLPQRDRGVNCGSSRVKTSLDSMLAGCEWTQVRRVKLNYGIVVLGKRSRWTRSPTDRQRVRMEPTVVMTLMLVHLSTDRLRQYRYETE